MGKTQYQSIPLDEGEVRVYDFGEIRLHCYSSNDAMGDQVAIVERAGRGVAIENPSFVASELELGQYLEDRGIEVPHKLLSYHMAGAKFLPQASAYATKKAIEFGNDGGKKMIKGFRKVFGQSFDTKLNTINAIVRPGDVKIGDLNFNLIETPWAFDIEISDINVLYLHMLGHDVHSIAHSAEDLTQMIEQLARYHKHDYALILSGHHAPETNADIVTKIKYLEYVRRAVDRATSASDFIADIKAKYPDYGGENYLEMTAEAFFAG